MRLRMLLMSVLFWCAVTANAQTGIDEMTCSLLPRQSFSQAGQPDLVLISVRPNDPSIEAFLVTVEYQDGAGLAFTRSEIFARQRGADGATNAVLSFRGGTVSNIVRSRVVALIPKPAAEAQTQPISGSILLGGSDGITVAGTGNVSVLSGIVTAPQVGVMSGGNGWLLSGGFSPSLVGGRGSYIDSMQYRTGGRPGISGTRTAKDADGNTKTLTISGGIITEWAQ